MRKAKPEINMSAIMNTDAGLIENVIKAMKYCAENDSADACLNCPYCDAEKEIAYCDKLDDDAMNLLAHYQLFLKGLNIASQETQPTQASQPEPVKKRRGRKPKEV